MIFDFSIRQNGIDNIKSTSIFNSERLDEPLAVLGNDICFCSDNGYDMISYFTSCPCTL